MRRFTFISWISAWITTLTIIGSAPAHADAASGLCGSGSNLTSYTTSLPAYNAFGQLMWIVRYRKTWCYTYPKHRVDSWTAHVGVQFYGGFGTAWSYEGINDSAAYYSPLNARGYKTIYPRLSHVTWVQVHMKHCFYGHPVCDDQYFHLGIRAFYDGSKKLA